MVDGLPCRGANCRHKQTNKQTQQSTPENIIHLNFWYLSFVNCDVAAAIHVFHLANLFALIRFAAYSHPRLIFCIFFFSFILPLNQAQPHSLNERTQTTHYYSRLVYLLCIYLCVACHFAFGSFASNSVVVPMDFGVALAVIPWACLSLSIPAPPLSLSNSLSVV